MSLNLEQDREELLTSHDRLSKSYNDLLVVMQAAWIEWTHGEGAESAMEWIDNTLSGPGLIPDETDPFGKEAQAYFDANRSDPFPRCSCGHPSSRMGAAMSGERFGGCCHEHLEQQIAEANQRSAPKADG